MNPFIKKQEFNYINRLLIDLKQALNNCLDPKIIEATKMLVYQRIINIFPNLSEEEKNIFDFGKMEDSKDIVEYLERTRDYVYGLKTLTNAQICRLFKKEKKLKVPMLTDSQMTPLVYLGWRDEGIRKLYIAYEMNDKLVGMACDITINNSNHTHLCTLCNHMGEKNEVTFVSAVCKSNATDEYRAIGFEICLDSKKCNERIVDVTRLEELLKKVNNI